MAALGLSLAVGAGAQSGTRRALSLEDYYRIEGIGSPAMSPDGTRVAFVRSVVLEDENRRHTEVWIVPSDGSSPPSRLTNPAFSASGPQWSPDGRLLGFTSRRRTAGAREDDPNPIWFLRMDRASGEAFQIEGVTAPPVFSPDNRWIAMIAVDPHGPKRPAPAYASDVEKKIHERFKGHIYDWMNFRFDGRGYLPDPRDPAATPSRDLLLVPREGGSPRVLTSLGVDVQSVAWRPDSRALAFVADTRQRDERTYERADLFTVDLEGRVRRLTDDGYDHDAPAWSPDGAAIVFRRQQGLDQVLQAKQRQGSAVDLFRISIDGSAATNLTSAWDDIPGPPSWHPDGSAISFSAGVRGTTHLYRVPSAGGRVVAVTGGERRLGGFSLSSDGARMAYTAQSPVAPAEVFVAAGDGSGELKVTSLNDALLRTLDLAQASPLRFRSKDGTPIEGWVLMPPAARGTASRVPLILDLHGGPHGAYGYEFSFQRQLWAAHGHAVVYTNPRGSTEYGEPFLWATWGGWGNLDFDDVMGGVEAAIAAYPIDTARLAVTGYSYGGFLTNWIITRTTRFAAAVVGAGISNWISDYGTADIPRTKETEFYGPPWDARGNETLRRQSPIEQVGNVVTPTLFIHGESDLRVPIEQGEQMYTALKKRGVAAKFVRYPESYHGGWAPWNTVHRFYQELKWWEQYLGTAR